MTIETIVYVFVALIAGALLAYLLLRRNLAKLSLELTEAKVQLKERTQSYERERELAKKSELSVAMFPYKEEHGENGFFSDERRAEVGYKYQIFVAGVPCFDAHKIPIDVLSKKQVTPERIEQAMRAAFELVGSFASKHPAFAAFQSASAAADGVRKALSKGDA